MFFFQTILYTQACFVWCMDLFYFWLKCPNPALHFSQNPRHRNPRPSMPPFELAYLILRLSNNLRLRSPCRPILAPPSPSEREASSTSPADQCSVAPPSLSPLSASGTPLAESRDSGQVLAHYHQLQDTLCRRCHLCSAGGFGIVTLALDTAVTRRLTVNVSVWRLWMRLSWILRADWSDITR